LKLENFPVVKAVDLLVLYQVRTFNCRPWVDRTDIIPALFFFKKKKTKPILNISAQMPGWMLL
jgi:hypothetical protein